MNRAVTDSRDIGHTGSCLCGAVAFSINMPLKGVTYCHCSQCRKQSGIFYASTNVPLSGFTLTRHDGLAWYAASDIARRGFCKDCGSFLFWQANGSDRIAVSAGALDMPTGLEAERHIFVDDKADFYDIADDLPQFAQSNS